MTRQELYDLVWSAPMRAVAEQIGLSDKTVAKRCQTHGVPTPPRGYWTQALVQRSASRPPLVGDAAQIIPMAPEASAVPVAEAGAALPSRTAGALVAETAHQPVERGEPALGFASLRALAATLQAHDAMTMLVDRVESRALTLPANQARKALRWAAVMRTALDQQDPAETLLSVLQACDL